MWNTTKYCKNCHFTIAYDKNSRNNKEGWKYCPICGDKLIKGSFSPDL